MWFSVDEHAIKEQNWFYISFFQLNEIVAIKFKIINHCFKLMLFKCIYINIKNIIYWKMN